MPEENQPHPVKLEISNYRRCKFTLDRSLKGLTNLKQVSTPIVLY